MQRRQGFLDCSGQLHVLTFRLRLSLLLCLLLLALFLLLCRLSLMSLSQLFLAGKTLARLLLLLLELLPVWLFKPVAQGLIILEEVPDLCQRPVCNPPATLPSESLRVPIAIVKRQGVFECLPGRLKLFCIWRPPANVPALICKLKDYRHRHQFTTHSLGIVGGHAELLSPFAFFVVMLFCCVAFENIFQRLFLRNAFFFRNFVHSVY